VKDLDINGRIILEYIDMKPYSYNKGARKMAVAREWLCKNIHCQTMALTSHVVPTIGKLQKRCFLCGLCQGFIKESVQSLQ
jgi:hypothetical protein